MLTRWNSILLGFCGKWWNSICSVSLSKSLKNFWFSDPMEVRSSSESFLNSSLYLKYRGLFV